MIFHTDLRRNTLTFYKKESKVNFGFLAVGLKDFTKVKDDFYAKET